jgi:hypothetical protein
LNFTDSNRPARISPLGWGLPLLAMALVQLSFWEHVSDDAYISFRYVARWVTGQGLTFNPGEQVEGFSNPLWVGVLALSQLLLPAVTIVDAARVLGFSAAVISLVAVAAIVMRSSPGRESTAFAYAAFILVCTPGFHLYATAGLETPLLGMLITLAVLLSVADTFTARLGAAACLGLAATCRPEAPLYALLWWIFTSGASKLRTHPGREMLVMVLLGAPFAAYEAFRLVYFGDLLPNTFTAKPPGIFGGLFGIGYVLQWVTALGGPVLLVVWILKRSPLETNAHHLFRAAGGPVLAATIFVAYSQGDWMPFGRFLVPVAPLLAACAGTVLARWTFDTARERGVPSRRVVMPVAIALGLSAAAAWGVELRAYMRNEGLSHIMRGTDQVAAGRWVAEHIRAGSTVATKRLGGISFAAPDLVFWDLFGLTDREQALFINAGKRFGGGMSPVERRLPDVMAVTDIPGDDRNGYKSEPGTPAWLEARYIFVKSLPQGNAGTFDIWVTKAKFDAVMKRSN